MIDSRLKWTGCLFLLFLVACSPQKNVETEDEVSRPEVTLNVLVIDDAAIANSAERRWSAEGMGTTEISQMSLTELSAKDFQLGSDIDVVIYPSQVMAELISRDQLMAIPKSSLDSDFANRKELLQHQRKILQRFGGDVWTMPLGDPQLTLVYNSKTFKELELAPPKTWDEFLAVAGKLKDAGHQVEVPLADGWASRTFLSRVASYVRVQGKLSTVFDIESMSPTLESAPFVKSLTELKQAISNPPSTTGTPSTVFQNLVAGKTAMGLTWPSEHFSTADTEAAPLKVNDDLSIIRLPGSKDWFDQVESQWQNRDPNESMHIDVIGSTGRVASVNKNCRFASASLEFVTWVCSKATSASVSTESPNVSMFRATHLGQPTRWTGELISPIASDQFSDVIREIAESKIVFVFPRLPGQSEYLAALDQAVIKFLDGNASAEEALRSASQKWEAITDRMGRESQKKYLRRSEGFSN